MNLFRINWSVFILSLAAGLALPELRAEAPPGWHLRPSAQVDATGVFLDQLFTTAPAELPHLRLAPAPAAGHVLNLNRTQLNELLGQHAPDFAPTNWSGAAQIKISRRTRALAEAELKALLEIGRAHV